LFSASAVSVPGDAKNLRAGYWAERRRWIAFGEYDGKLKDIRDSDNEGKWQSEKKDFVLDVRVSNTDTMFYHPCRRG
jgi:hypothetical protein